METRPVRKTLSLTKEDYYKTHLSIVNPLLPNKMTPKEIDVLALFMSFDGIIGEDRFGATARKIVKGKLQLSDGGLGNYIKSLRNKSLIRSSSDVPSKLTILPILIPGLDQQEYQFKLTKINESVES